MKESYFKIHKYWRSGKPIVNELTLGVIRHRALLDPTSITVADMTVRPTVRTIMIPMTYSAFPQEEIEFYNPNFVCFEVILRGTPSF